MFNDSEQISFPCFYIGGNVAGEGDGSRLWPGDGACRSWAVATRQRRRGLGLRSVHPALAGFQGRDS